jgi:hypothetical protein
VAVYRVLIELFVATSEPVMVVGGGGDIMQNLLRFTGEFLACVAVYLVGNSLPVLLPCK